MGFMVGTTGRSGLASCADNRLDASSESMPICCVAALRRVGLEHVADLAGCPAATRERADRFIPSVTSGRESTDSHEKLRSARHPWPAR